MKKLPAGNSRELKAIHRIDLHAASQHHLKMEILYLQECLPGMNKSQQDAGTKKD